MMNIVDSTGTKDFTAKVSDIQTLINTYLTTTLKTSQSTLADKATNADVTNLNTSANAIVNFQIGNGKAYNKTINNVQNATNATNVNVTNKNSANNAIVNFQLGNGTEYNKTINNVANATNAANATTVQNIDFSSNTSAKFGNYTVVKRKKISNSSISITADNNKGGTSVSMQLTEALSIGDIVEVEYSLNATIITSIHQLSRFVYQEGDHAKFYPDFSFSITELDGSSIVMSLYGDGHINNSTLTLDRVFGYNQTLKTYTNNVGTLTIYNVYKIL